MGKKKIVRITATAAGVVVGALATAGVATAGTAGADSTAARSEVASLARTSVTGLVGEENTSVLSNTVRRMLAQGSPLSIAAAALAPLMFWTSAPPAAEIAPQMFWNSAPPAAEIAPQMFWSSAPPAAAER